ncbi:hypothetical protein [Paraclostridium sordellii]|uniref:hypothetical protein n=1 Tax=Paraclostridium sordellii TaxID=1505 RepID=UPI00096A51C7|nr:hypothetical protein [Paeniclostridium sordellii]
MNFPDNFNDYLSSEGFCYIVNFIHPSPTNPNTYIYLNNNPQLEIDSNIVQHKNDYIKSGVTYTIADYVNHDNCKAIVLIEPETIYNKKLVKALIKDSRQSYNSKSDYILWSPVIEFLVADLDLKDKEVNEFILELLEYTSNNLDKSISDIFLNFYGSYSEDLNIKFTSHSGSTTDIDIYLYFSVVKETMKLEDIRYPKSYHYGKNLFKIAYQALALDNMDYNEWRSKFYFDKN